MQWRYSQITSKQLELIKELVDDLNEYGVELNPNTEARLTFKKPVHKLSVEEASEFITALIAEKRYAELTFYIDEIY
jgi:hypothetical protein